MSFDEYFGVCYGDNYDPRAIAEWECPHCGRTWQLIYRGYDEKWISESMMQDEEPMIGQKCAGCILDDMKPDQLIGYAEEYGKRAMVLRGLLSKGGAPLNENEPVIEWAWSAFKDSDKALLAETVRDALWFEREQMTEYMRECV